MSLTASQITKIAKIILSQRCVYSWRHNQIRVPGRAFIGEPGCSDLLGFNIKTGVFVACEVKTVDDGLSDDQKDFLQKVKNAGGIAVIACEDAGGNVVLVDIYEYLIKNNR